MPNIKTNSRSLVVSLAPFGIFSVLALLTLWVWHQQVNYQWNLLARHTEDICQQVSRRLQILVESRLQTATIFAQRWSTHESQDFSQERFVEFASVLIKDVPGYHSMRIIQPQIGGDWVVPKNVSSSWTDLGDNWKLLADEALQLNEIVLSAPFETKDDNSVFFAVLPLKRDLALLGYLAVEFNANKLIGTGFQSRIRKEFKLSVVDEGKTLFQFQHIPKDDTQHWLLRTVKKFAVQNRTWTISVAPRKNLIAGLGWSLNSLSVLLLGIVLSIGLSGLVHLLNRRVDLYREARDRALLENEAREKAQDALRASESRYRSVFRSATDGLLVLDTTDKIIEANPAASAMHGYQQDDFVGRSLREFIPIGHQPLYDEFKRQLREFGTARFDSMSQRMDGSTLDVEVRGSTFNFGGEPRVLAIITDVSEIKRALQRHTTLSRKVLVAQEEERARVSRELHDELGQILTALHLELNWLSKKAPSREDQGHGNALEMVEKAANELRRICKGLRPPLLDDLGLEPAVQLLVEEFEERSKIKVNFKVQLDENENPIPREVSLATYRVLQESLNNVTRHAKANRVSITLECNKDDLNLSIYDNGRGFDTEAENATMGSGINGMNERAYLVNGTIDIRSEAFQGTRVNFRVPLKKSARRNHDQNTCS
ncbi:MAG: PAS domain-containing sensor histidine kinase [Pseudomonadota bacterium]